MPKILAVTDEMMNRAGNIGQSTSEILDSQHNVTRTFQNMGRDFSGRIPSLMTEKMIAMEEVYQNMNMILNGYKEFLEDAARNYEWTDQEAARWTRSLSNGGVN